MNRYENQEFEGERALYNTHDAEIDHCRFHDGESHLKECSGLDIKNSSFEWKYPLWYSDQIVVDNCFFALMSRSGIWYTDNIIIRNSVFDCPKTFRRSSFITLENCKFNSSGEMFWNCHHIVVRNSTFKDGDYMFMNCNNIEVDGFHLDGNYVFDGASNIKVKDSSLNSKDSFWNVHNAYVEDSTIVGEYIGWNSENLTFVNCEIESEQGFCYIKGLKMRNCRLKGTNLSFELCEDIDAEIIGNIVSIKNPISGRIVCDSCDEVIIDKAIVDPSKTEIIIGGKKYEI